MSQNRMQRTAPRVETSSHVSSVPTQEPVEVRELSTCPQIRYPFETAEAHSGPTKTMDESIIELSGRVHDYIVSGQGRTEAEIRERFGLPQKTFDTVLVWLLANGDIDLDNRNGQINLRLRWQRFLN